MRVRSILLSTAVLLSTAGMSSALAAAAIQKPQGTWAVTRVEAKQPGSAPYCALARRFGNGSIVTFARNANSETSVAVDFPPNSFKQTQNYTIVLDPGAGESRSYKTRPISERGIVIRMGRDDKFYTALEQTGTLGISVDDKSYAFSMADLKNGTQDLSACLGAAVAPAAGDAAPNDSARVPGKVEKMANAVLPDRAAPAPGSLAVGSSGDEMQSLKEENIRLRNALERERRSYEDKMQQADSSSNAAELTERLQLLQTENAQLKDKLNSSRATISPEGVPDTRFESLKAENSKLKLDLDAAQKQISLAPAANIKGDDKTVVGLRAENAQLKTDLEQEKQKVAQMEIARKTFVDNKPAVPDRGDDPLVKMLKEQVEKLQDENSALKLAAAGKPATSDDMKAGVASIAKMHTLEDQLAAVTADRDRLNAQIGSMKLASTGPNAKISSDNWNLETATQRYNEAEREIQRLGSVVEAERAKCIVEKKNIEYMLFDPKIASKQQIAKLMSLENQLTEARQGIDVAKDKAIKDMTVQLAEAKKTSDASLNRVAANDKAAADIKTQLAAANAKVAQLQTEVENEKSRSLAVNDKTINDMKLQLTASNDQITQLKKSLDDTNRQKLAQSAAATDQTALVNSLKQEIVSLNNQMANMQSEKTASVASRMASIPPAAGGESGASRLSARPDSVVPAVQIDTAGLSNPATAAPALVRPVSVAPVQSIASATASDSKLMTVGDVRTLLSQAGVKLSGDIAPVPDAAGPGRVSYRWKSDGLFGTLEQKTVDNAGQYDNLVQAYIEKAKSRCKGQFAAVPGMTNMNGGTRISAYEIACVDDKSGDGASASVAFYSQNGTFTSVAHEASSESMDLAMDARDKIMTTVDSGMKSASR